jgi:hypothetical protein
MTISLSSYLMQASTIERLILIGIQINLAELFIVAPMVHQLDAELIINQPFYDQTIFQSSLNLQQLSIKIDHMTMLEIRYLLSSMIHLTYLTLHIYNTENDLINGHT